MKKVLVSIMVAALVGVAAMAQPAQPPFSLHGMFITSMNALVGGDGVDVGTGLDNTVYDGKFAIEANGTGITFAGGVFGSPGNYPLTDWNTYDVHTTLFDGVLKVAAGSLDDGQYNVPGIIIPAPGAPMAGDSLGNGETNLGVNVKVTPIKELSFGLFIPMTLYTDTNADTVLDTHAGLALADAYGKVELAASYAIDGVGNVFAGLSLLDEKAYGTFQLTAVKDLAAAVSVSYDWTGADGLVAGVNAAYTMDKLYVGAEFIYTAAHTAGAIDVAGKVQYTLSDLIKATLVAKYAYNAAPFGVPGNFVEVNPNCDIGAVNVGFKFDYYTDAATYTWAVPVSVSMLVF